MTFEAAVEVLNLNRHRRYRGWTIATNVLGVRSAVGVDVELNYFEAVAIAEKYVAEFEQ